MMLKTVYRLIRWLVIVLVWIIGLSASAQASTDSLVHDGIERTFHVYIPSSLDESEPALLVIALHPTMSSGKAMEAVTGFDTVADDDGFIVVYPENAGYYWDDGRVEAGLQPQEGIVDDVGFIGALVDHLVANYNIDTERIFLTGFDNGGTMAYRLACEMPERFAGVAVVGTLMWDYLRDTCPEPSAPIDLLIILGSEDTYYPLEGRTLPAQRNPLAAQVLGIDTTLDFWVSRNGCDSAFEQPEDYVAVFSQCENDTQVAAYLVEGNGHSWPRIGDYTLNQYGVNATEIIAHFFIGDEDWMMAPADLSQTDRLWNVVPRSFRLFVPPSYDPAEPMPLVVVLHGRPGNGAGIAYITDMNIIAREEGFIALYPDALDQTWNYVINLRSGRQVDDTLFLSALIDDLSIDLNIDQRRIYVTGFSNGGFMTQLLACEAPDQYAAFAVVGATLFPGLDQDCEGVRPVPLLLMHGTQDVSVPWFGRQQQTASGDSIYIASPVPDTVRFWAEHNGCADRAETTEVPRSGDSPGTQVIQNQFTGCDDGSPLVFYMIGGGGHNWPGVPGRISEEIAGQVNMDIHASQVIWDFFSQHEWDLED